VRVLYFTRDYSPHDHRFLTALAQTEHQVYALRLERGNRQLEDRSLPTQIEQVAWKGGQREVNWSDTPALLLDLQRVTRKIKPDVIHAGPVPNVAFLAALSGFKPLVSMSWGSDLLRDIEQDGGQMRSARFALKRSAVLVGDCEAVKQKAVSLGFPAERVVLFPWGVDLQTFSPAESMRRQRLGWEDAFVLLSLRTWEPLYGVEHVIRAFCRAAQEFPDLRLLLLGNGSQAALIHGLVQSQQMVERVHFGGQVKNDDLPDYYRSADLYISASHSDGSSVSLMEALACGIPALVSDIPGNREWMAGQAAGWLFTDGDEDSLVEGIRRAVRERASLAERGQAARKLAEARADWTKNFPKLLDAYEMAIRIGRG
jgi:glycosyltransferase involved in cell wall biosynthesis